MDFFIYKYMVYFDEDRVSLESQPTMQVSPVQNQCSTEKQSLVEVVCCLLSSATHIPCPTLHTVGHMSSKKQTTKTFSSQRSIDLLSGHTTVPFRYNTASPVPLLGF